MTTRAPYKKRLQQHLRETKDQAKQLERRIKKLGGSPDATSNLPGPDSVTETVANIAGRAGADPRDPWNGRGREDAEERQGRIPRGGGGGRELRRDRDAREHRGRQG